MEASNARETRQRARDFIPVQRAEIRIAHWQLTVGVVLRLEQQAVAWAVHGLQTVRLILAEFTLGFTGRTPAGHLVHVILVVLPVAGDFPQRAFVDGRGQDFAEAVLQVLGSEEGDELVDDVSTIGEEERRAGTVG